MSFLSAIGPLASIAGGLIGGRGDKEQTQQNQNQQTSTGLPAWAQPYLQGALNQGQAAFGTPELYYPDQPFANIDYRRDAGLRGAYDLAQGGGAMVNPTLDYAKGVLGGDYLGSPHLADASKYAIDKFVPQSLSQFENMGRSGSGLAAHAMGEGVSDAVAGQYNTERDRMDNMARMSPQLEQLAYSPFGVMQDVGQQYENREQQSIDWMRDKWGFQQNEPKNRAMQYSQFLGNTLPFAGQQGTRQGTQSQDMYGPSLGERVAGIGNLAGGVAQQFFGTPGGGRGNTVMPHVGGSDFNSGNPHRDY